MFELEQKEVDRIFPQYDPQEVSDQIRAEERGREDGNQNRPPNGATTMSVAEAEIVSFFEDVIRNAAASTRVMLGKFREYRRELDFNVVLEDLRGLSERFTNENRHLKARDKGNLQEQRDRERRLRGNLETFRNENGLNHTARPKENPITFWLVILAFIAVETALNATFFAMGSELGFLGGIIQATIISGINVGAAVLCGLFWVPFINHRKFAKKLVGGLSILLWSALILTLNIFAGHYRSELEQDPLLAVTEAVVSIQQSFFGIESAQGWLLSAVGILTSLAVLVKVYFSDDPYPGYSKVFRAHKAANEEWLNAKSEFVEQLKKNSDNFEQERNRLWTDARRVVTNFEGYIGDSRVLAASYKDYQHRVATWCTTVISLYRSANSAVRQDPVPAYFGDKADLDFSHLKVENDLSEDAEELNHLKQTMREFSAAEVGAIKRQLAGIQRQELDTLDLFFENFVISDEFLNSHVAGEVDNE